MSMGGGSGGSGQQTNTFTPPLWTQNQWPDLVQSATTLYTQPQQQYYGQRIAGINDTQAQGMQYLSNLSGNNSPDMAAMRRNLQLTAAGAYENPYATAMTAIGDNPYEGNSVASALMGLGAQYNPTQTAQADNEFKGFGPQYQQFKQNSMNDVVRNYQQAIAPQTDAAFNHAGAFHAGGHDAAIANNQNALAQNLGRMSTEMDQGQWQNSANLQQGLVQMNQQASLQDQARNLQGQQGWWNLFGNTALQDEQRNSGLAQQGINLGVQAQQNDINRATQAWDAERNRQMGASGAIMQAHQSDIGDARNMIGIGDIQRGYSQDLMNLGYQDWQQQQNYPQQMLDAYANMLARASGNYGQNMSMYSQPGYQANPFATAFGIGTVGAGLYNSMGG